MATEDKNINNPEPSPKGQEEVVADGNKDDSQIADEGNLKDELEEIERKLKESPQPEPEKPKVPEEKPEENPKEETQETEQVESEVSEDLLKKSPEELAKMYTNLQKKLGEHSNELGELRKFREEQDKLKKEVENYQLTASNQHLVNNIIDKMTPEQTNEFLEKLASNPKQALIPVINEVIKPYALTQAKYNNMMAVQELKDNTKEDLLPYEKVEKEVNELLAKRDKNGRNELWDRYGSGAFEKAYNEVKQRKLPEVLKQREQEIISKAEEKAEQEYKKKMKAYTEPQGPTSRNVGNTVDYDNMDPEEAVKRLEKILPQ